jgi:hypothetical protein
LEDARAGVTKRALASIPMHVGPSRRRTSCAKKLGLLVAAGLGLLPARTAASLAPPGDGGHEWRWLGDWYEASPELSDNGVVPPQLMQSEMRSRIGDDRRWADPGWDDRNWTVEADRQLVLRKNQGIYWVRVRVRAGRQPLPTGVYVIATAAYDFYWDGVLVHRSGVPGTNPVAEIPGDLYASIALPPALTNAGEHVMALRLSTFHFNRPDEHLPLVVLNVIPERLVAQQQQRLILPYMSVGAMLVATLAAAIMWLAATQRTTLLLFTGLALGSTAFMALAIWRVVAPLPYSQSYPWWCVQGAIAEFAALCLVGLILVQFELPRRRWLLSLFVALQALNVWGHDFHATQALMDLWRITFVAALGLGVWAAFRRQPGAALVLAGLGVTLLLYEQNRIDFMRVTFLPTILPALAGLLLAIALKIRREIATAQENRLLASRLKLELLRKSLQPHFLMNTLTVLAQALAENPGKATALIGDLAEEFEALNRASARKCITLGEEVALCRTHLRVMSVRTELPWSLLTTRIDPAVPIPPALFLTLIENGFSHQSPVDGSTSFDLCAYALPNGARYVFFSPGQVVGSPSAGGSGTGLRYVKARLEENWPGRWRFGHSEVPGGWQTIIDIVGAAVATPALP